MCMSFVCTCMRVFMPVCVHAFVSLRLHVCVCAYVYVCARMCVCVYVCAHVRKFSYAHLSV